MDFFAGPSASGNVRSSASTTTSTTASTTTTMTTTGAGGKNVVMRLRRTWDVKMPPPIKYMVNERMMYTGIGQLNLVQRQRKICIEILGPDREEEEEDVLHDTAESSDTRRGSKLPENGSRIDAGGRIRNQERYGPGSLRRSSMMIRSRTTRHFIDLSSELKDDDLVVIRILKHRKGRWGINRDPEDSDSSDDNDDDDDDGGDSDSDSDSDSGSGSGSDSESLVGKKQRNWMSKRRANKRERNKWLEAAIKEYKAANKYGITREEDWIEYRKFGLDKIKDGDKQYRRTWVATIGLDKYREKRKIIFRSREQAQDFKTEIDKLRKLTKERAVFRLEAYKKYKQRAQARAEQVLKNSKMPLKFERSKSMQLVEDIRLLVEIVSCSDLPIASSTSTDPYVVVFLGVNAIHRTDYIPRELNPVWTIRNGSLFMVSCSAEEFFSFTYGLVFCVKDYDIALNDGLVGRAELTQSQLLSMTGERIAIELDVPLALREHVPSRGRSGENAIYTPKLYLRIRKATPVDKAFIQKMNSIKRSKRQGVYADKTFKANADVMGLFKREAMIVDGVKMCRVKPGPDPNRPPEETSWMTESQMVEEARKPSHSWVESGNGKLGKIYVEVLKCDKLPNLMFHHKVSGGKSTTDPDGIGYTDVIRNSVEPRWMPWSQRAFVFNVSHASSNLMIGVFDHELSRFHYPIGRVSVNMTNLSPKTEYVLTFDLYRSAMLDNNRKPEGKITIRIRIDLNNQGISNYTLGAARNLPAKTHLNLPNKSEFMTVYYVCHGDEDPGRFSLETLYAYQAELEEYFVHVHLIQQAAIKVLLWRGHYHIKIFGRSLCLPLHSLVAFVMGVTLVENFNLLPSCALFSIAWLLTAAYEARQAHPSPWTGTLTLTDMWSSAIFKKSVPVTVTAFENEAAVVKYEKEMTIRYEEEQEMLKRRQETMQQLAELYGDGSTEPEDLLADRTTKKAGSVIIDKINAVNPLATSLLPIQQMLGKTASFIRILRSLISWDESIYAFLILNVSLVLGIVFLFIPWDWLARWSLRIVTWCLLGPWMKLIDLYVLPKYFGTDLDKDKLLANYAKEQIDSLGLTKGEILRKREDVYKLKAMKRYMFGRYSVMVPRYKDYRYRDTPLPESSATPVQEVQDIKISAKWPGQRLRGDMIPIWGVGLDQRQRRKKVKKE